MGMKRKTPAAAAIVAGLFLALMAAPWASAHARHEKATRETPVEGSRSAPEQPVAPAAPKAPATVETELHDHADPEQAAGTVDLAADESIPDGPNSNLPKPLAWLGKFHPPLTHFPIALLIAATVAEVLYIQTREALFDHAVRFSVWLGAGGAIAAAGLGWLFAGYRFVDDEWVMTAHRWAGTATALLAVCVLVLCERANTQPASRQSFRVVLFACAAFVAATGFLGGALLYGLDHFAWEVSQ
jgi:uncharacterized membrane protein